MQSHLPQLTTVLLLIHLGFGCCFHHAHACEAECCPTPVAASEACPCRTHEHDEDSVNYGSTLDDFADGGHHGEQHHCAGEQCTFIALQPSLELTGEFVANSFALKVIAAGDEASSCRNYLDRNLDRLLPIAGPSLRTHLALRVLLV